MWYRQLALTIRLNKTNTNERKHMNKNIKDTIIVIIAIVAILFIGFAPCGVEDKQPERKCVDTYIDADTILCK